MAILLRLLLVLGVASITFGVARSQIVPEILSKQEKHFDRFFAEHREASTNILQDVVQLRRRVMLSGGLYAGWPQAIGPVAFGLMVIAISSYENRRRILKLKRPSNPYAWCRCRSLLLLGMH